MKAGKGRTGRAWWLTPSVAAAAAPLAVVTLCIGPIVGEGRHDAAASGRPTLVEAQGCAAVSPDPPRTDDPASTGQTVRVVVPATALLQIDGHGTVVGASTNTGCAPRPTDQVVDVHPDGSAQPVPSSSVTGVRWVGDFTQPGVVQPQSPG